MLYYIQGMQDGTKIVFDTHETIVSMSPFVFINDWCIANGSTYDGRRKAACALLKIHQKVPILICALKGDILFPIVDTKRKDGCWINYRSIYAFKRDKTCVCIQFLNTLECCFNVDIRNIQRSMRLCEEMCRCLRIHR